MAKYMTPDFDVTVYEIKDTITIGNGDDNTWTGSDHYGEDD